jgi:hypothetical protein
VTRICAAVSGQIYHVDGDASKFDLHLNDHRVEVLHLVTQGDYGETIPPFVLVKTGTLMIIGWRGSSTITNWMTDFNSAQVVSRMHPNLRIHGGFLALIESDFVQYEAIIVDLITKHTITKVIFTGHSLGMCQSERASTLNKCSLTYCLPLHISGGALALVAHVQAATLMARDDSVWNKAKVSLRTIAFAAPMAIAIEPNTQPGSVVDQVASNACNIIYDYDPVPRAYSMMNFIAKVANSAIDNIGWGIGTVLRLFLPKELTVLMDKGVEELTAKEEKRIRMILRAMFRYRHLGKLVFYEHAEAEPVEVVDEGPIDKIPVDLSMKSSTEKKLFSSIVFDKKRKGVSMESIAATHNLLVLGPGLAYNIINSESS